MNDEGTPLSHVLDNSHEIANVTIMLAITSIDTNRDAVRLINWPAARPPKKIVDSAIKVGKRPLHGTKLFVSIAIRRSLGDSIILHAIIPAALQPKPILMVRDCLPWVPAFLNNLSKLNATLGR